jgi:protein SCO1
MEKILEGRRRRPGLRERRGAARGRSPGLLLVVLVVAGGALAAAAAGHRYLRTVASYRPPAVTLLDAGGQPVAFAALLDAGGPVALQFIFTTCPAVCPVLTSTLAAAEKALGPDGDRLRLLAVTIDPEHDRPALLADYARRFGIAPGGPRWRFLTGDRDDVEAVLKAFDADSANKMEHRPLTLLRAAPGAPWVRLEGFPSAAELAAELRRILGPGPASDSARVGGGARSPS